jgi:3D (Asp-Asp-Asp) domain-containing protein
MHCSILRSAMLITTCLVAGCASRPLPKYEKPIARAPVQRVRTTAYTHSEADHLKHGRSTAMGTTLQYGAVRSAAADWSRWPAGSLFRIRETGELYRVDDYGWALAGTNTIDLYKPSRSMMNRWGVRYVTIENLEWGNVDRSRTILRGRSKHKHVRRMLNGLDKRYAVLKKPMAPAPIVVAEQAAPAAEAAEPVTRLASATVTKPAPLHPAPPLTPFRSSGSR